jgi:phosphotriesterase-related protein
LRSIVALKQHHQFYLLMNPARFPRAIGGVLMAKEYQVSRRNFLVSSIGAAVVLSEGQPAGALPGSAESSVKAKPGTVQTVLGPIDTAKLGFTQSHEHVCSTSAGFWGAWPELFGGRAAFVKATVEKLKSYKAGGLDSFIDLTTLDLGRDIRLIEEVSKKSGVQIVACTGHWLDPSRSMNARTLEELVELFTKEIQVGIEGTPIKAGVIKVANDLEGITPFGDRLLRAASRTSKATGTPISTHTWALDKIGEKQAAIFEQEGVNPSKVCIGHSDDTPDVEYLTGLARRGYYIGMDRLPTGLPLTPGTPPPPPNQVRATLDQRIASIKHLIDQGFANRVMLGTDYPIGLGLGATATWGPRDARNPDGINFVRAKAIPLLKKAGVQDAAIKTMTVENPKRYFDGA